MSISSQSTLVKIILAWFGLYGLIRRLESPKTSTKILGIVIFLTGCACGVFWIIDLITVIMKGDITVLA